MILNVVNSTGEFLLGDLVGSHAHAAFPGNAAAQKEFIGAFYGRFFANVNLLGFLLQTFAVSRLFARTGVRGALYVLPTIALMSYSTIALVPLSAGTRSSKTPPTIRSRTPCGRPCSCRPRARPNTRPKLPSTRSSRGSATF